MTIIDNNFDNIARAELEAYLEGRKRVWKPLNFKGFKYVGSLDNMDSKIYKAFYKNKKDKTIFVIINNEKILTRADENDVKMVNNWKKNKK